MATNKFYFEWEGSEDRENFFNAFEHTLDDGYTVQQALPSMYQVMLLNDEETPMDFVVHVLQSIFHNSKEDAHSTMLLIHQEERAICATFTREVAETKIMQVIDFARKNNYPLKCVMQREHRNAF